MHGEVQRFQAETRRQEQAKVAALRQEVDQLRQRRTSLQKRLEEVERDRTALCVHASSLVCVCWGSLTWLVPWPPSEASAAPDSAENRIGVLQRRNQLLEERAEGVRAELQEVERKRRVLEHMRNRTRVRSLPPQHAHTRHPVVTDGLPTILYLPPPCCVGLGEGGGGH